MHVAAKLILVFISSFILHDSFAQTFYSAKAKKRFDSLYKALPASFKKHQAKLKDYDNGLAMFMEYKIDTLNADDLPGTHHDDIVLQELGLRGGRDAGPRRPVSKGDDEVLMVPCYAGLSNDTLVIQVGMLFFGQQIVHLIIKKNLSTFYDVYSKYDSVFTLNVSDPLSDGLEMPADRVKFLLSDSVIKSGDIIYGNAEVFTKIYYQKDDWDENNFLKLRGRFKYYFRVIIQKGGKHDY